MSLFAIGDTHLSFGSDKPMDIFRGWQNFEERLEKNWNSVVSENDTVVIAGDISWAMNIEGAKEDFRFIDKLNGKKLIMKGNHDYWWSTKKKADTFFAENGFSSLEILFNNASESVMLLFAVQEVGFMTEKRITKFSFVKQAD